MMLEELPPAQRTVVQMLAEGCRCKDIALRLNVAVKTVESHMHKIYRKTKTHGLVEMLRHFYKFTLIETRCKFCRRGAVSGYTKSSPGE